MPLWGLLTTAWYGVSCSLSAAAAEHPQLVASGTTSQQIGMGCVHFTHLIPGDRFASLLMILVPVPLLLPIGGKSQPWFDTSCKLAACSKREAYQIWAEALVTKDPEVKTSKRKYNRASRFFKRQIARARSEHIAKI